jgi:hypothetical protein
MAQSAHVPADQDFDASKAFYELLGFAKVLDGEVAIYDIAESAGSSSSATTRRTGPRT